MLHESGAQYDAVPLIHLLHKVSIFFPSILPEIQVSRRPLAPESSSPCEPQETMEYNRVLPHTFSGTNK